MQVDPTIEYVPIEIEGKTYQMCFDLGSLAQAEAEINAAGGDIDVLHGIELEKLKLSDVLILFTCALRRAQPALKREDVLALVNRQNAKTLGVLYTAVAETFLKSYGIDDPTLEKKADATTETTDPS